MGEPQLRGQPSSYRGTQPAFLFVPFVPPHLRGGYLSAPLPPTMDFTPLIDLAKKARERAYAPYSKFAVGAALLTKSGRVVTGCNVENLSFGLTICAERAAVFAAIALGEKEFEAIAVVADSLTPVTPCGACRQVLAEFADDLPICSANLQDARFESTLRELLPRAKEGILGA
jgi:cytidine deaminase